MFNKFQEIYVMNRGGGGMGGGGGGGDQSTGGRRTFSYLASPTSVSTSMSGSETMADGSSIATWNFNNGGGFNSNRTVPSPVLEANQGSSVAFTLNVSMMSSPHTMHLHGLDVNQQNDGVGATSFEVNGGSSNTYRFTAPHAGTYMYHCHVDTNEHMEMGMFGTIIIRPSNGSTSQVWNNGPSFDKEYIWQLTTYDSSWHNGGGGGGMGGMGGGGGGSFLRYSPDYFMINGKDGNNANNDSATAITAGRGDKVLIRAVGTSYMPGVIRMGGLPFEVIASDGRPLAQSYTTTEQLCCAGERYDIMLTMPSSTGSYTGSIEYRNIQNTAVLGTATTDITVTW